MPPSHTPSPAYSSLSARLAQVTAALTLARDFSFLGAFVLAVSLHGRTFSFIPPEQRLASSRPLRPSPTKGEIETEA